MTDFRPLESIPVGNRFLVFTLFPQATVAVRVQWGPGREKVAVSAGRSIFNRTSRANLGVLMSVYGGGGHAGAGACLPARRHGRRPDRGDRRDARAEWVSSSSGRTCPGSTTGRTSARAPGSPAAGSPDLSDASGCAARSASSPTAAPPSCGGGCSATAARACARTARGGSSASTTASSRTSTRRVRALREAGLAPSSSSWTSSGSTRPATVNGVRLGGRRDHVRDPSRRARLLEHVFAPIAERYGREPAVAGWDLMNEPEWATLGAGDARPAARGVAARDAHLPGRDGRGLPRPRHAAPERGPRQRPVAVPRRRPRPRPAPGALVREPGPRDHPRAARRALGLGRPLAPRGVSDARAPPCRPARSSRWPGRPATPGALAWSALADDRATDARACRDALRAWSGRAAAASREA